MTEVKKNKSVFVLGALLLCSIAGNIYLFNKGKVSKPVVPVISQPLEIVTKTQPENLQYFLKNRLILESCDFIGEQATNYDDYMNTLVSQIRILADSEFINKSQQKVMAVIAQNEFMETYGAKADEATCSEAYKFAEYKWKQLNPIPTTEGDIDISNKQDISTPMEPQVQISDDNPLNTLPLPSSEEKKD